MPTGVAVTESGRIFVNFPRWGDDVPFTVGEIRNGELVAYPTVSINNANGWTSEERLVSVQSVVADAKNRLWILDTGSPEFREPVAGGAKLVAVDLATDRVAETIVLPETVVLPTTYVNDLRLNLRQGEGGVAYITDSSVKGPGGLIVVDLATKEAWRRLSGHPSVQADRSFVPIVEGEVLMMRPPDGPARPFQVAADGIALSADGQTLYYSPLSSRHLFSVPTALLSDRSVEDATVAAAVVDLGEKGASDGLEVDNASRLYATDYENNSVRRRLVDGSWETVAHDPRLLWPDSLSIGADGYLYVTANQLHRQPQFNGGQDLREKPYVLFRLQVGAEPEALK
ncbi:MAG: gluconolaconase [Rhodospirillales bacterium]|nr:gluconolaconase [Rhodospirillales bacterium]